VSVLFHETNQGVGAAVCTGYRAALADDMDIVVKLDGDGQMDPGLIRRLIAPIVGGHADYTKGNRFFSMDALASMPKVRLFGNAALSFVNKTVNGYWDVMDPTNGFTAIHRFALGLLPLERVDPRYFFESDMLFRLSVIRAVVVDVPMPARYGDEVSNLSVRRVLLEFPVKYMARFFKRIFHTYFLADFNAGSVALISGLPLLIFGLGFGLDKWLENLPLDRATPTGTVMLSVLPVLLGVQLLLTALNYDLSHIPRMPLRTLFEVRPLDQES